MTVAQKRTAMRQVMTSSAEPTSILKDRAGLRVQDQVYHFMLADAKKGFIRFHGKHRHNGREECYWSL